MAKVMFGNHSSVIVPRKDRDGIRKFYCDILGCEITKAEDDRDFLCFGENFYIAFLYGDVPDVSEFLRTARSVWLEIKSDTVEEMRRKILESGLVRKLDMPDPHLYFQAPGGQCMRLVGIDEDLSFYEGAAEGPNVAKIKEALQKEEMKIGSNGAPTVENSDVTGASQFESYSEVRILKNESEEVSMSMNELEMFLRLWDGEAERTVKLLGALPATQYDFRPDPAGRSLGELAWHLAEADAYISYCIETGQFSLETKPPNIARPRKVEELAPGYERVHLEAVARVRKLKPEDLDRSTPFFGGPKPVRDLLWNSILAHSIHHRGQLTLMCRLAGGQVPALYGPNREQTAAMRATANRAS